MRISFALALLVTLSGCGSVAKQPDGRRSPVGVLVPSIQGRCGTVLVGSNTKRICAPPPAEVDSAEVRDSTEAADRATPPPA